MVYKDILKLEILKAKREYTHTHTHISIYLYIYIIQASSIQDNGTLFIIVFVFLVQVPSLFFLCQNLHSKGIVLYLLLKCF